MYALIGSEGGAPLRWTLGEGTYVIGRRNDCDFLLADRTVSKAHAAIEISSAGEVMIADQNSRNGTFVNGRRITVPTKLPVGSMISMGRAKLLFVDDSASSRVSQTLFDLQMDLDLAAQVQRKLLSEPPDLPDSLQLTARLAQCGMVGGDMYDVARLGSDRIAIMIGDAVGHGISAAVLMSYVLASYRTMCHQSGFEPGNAVSAVSRLLCRLSEPTQFITAFIGVLQIGSGQLRYVNAGHNSPIIVRMDGSMERLSATGTLVGILQDSQWSEREAHLDQGDLLFLFTDGLIEARQEAELFGEERLIELLSGAQLETTERAVEMVADAIETYAGQEPFEDDITMIAVKKLRPAGTRGGR